MAQFTNQAQLSYNNTVVNSNRAVGELLEALSATKAAVSSTYSRNNNVAYVISIINSSDTAISGFTVTDNLGAYTINAAAVYPLTYVPDTVRVYVNGVLQATPTVNAGPPLSISALTIPAGGNMIIIYEATPNQFAPLGVGDSITNTVTINGGSIATDITAAETITPRTDPDLSITKSIEPVPVAENGRLTYTFVIQNFGNTAADAEDNVIVTDTFDPRMSDISVSFNGTPWSSPANYTYNQTTGVFATVAGQITVPAATFSQNPTTGVWTITPGVSTLVVTGTV